MKERILPTIIGLAIAALFILSPSVLLSHLMYLGAAYILYRELLIMDPTRPLNTPSSKAAVAAQTTRRPQRNLLILGTLALLFYALTHALLLHTESQSLLEEPTSNQFFTITVSYYQIASALILLITLVLFLITGYILNIFTSASTPSEHHPPSNKGDDRTEPVDFAASFHTLLHSLHALLYSTLFLYSIVKIKYSYLFVTGLGLTVTHSVFLLVMVWALAWIYDSAAYIGGTSWGRRKLNLPISPNKSWAGLYFGTAVTTASLLILYFIGKETFLAPLKTLWFFRTSWQMLLFALILTAAAQCGDLIASLFKRAAKVKDSGTLFGTHGGFLDRNDSAIFACTVFYYLLVFTREL